MTDLSIRSLLALAFLCWSVLAQADNNAALYDDVIPENAGFLRLLNLESHPADLVLDDPSLGQTVGGAQLGDFLVLPAGDYRAAINGTAVELAIAAGHATTLIFDGDNVTQHENPLPQNPRKAQVWFYNFSNLPLALKTADGAFSVVDTLTPGSQGERQVNEIKLAFAAYDGNELKARFAPMLLRKGRSYSYLVIENDQGLQVRAKLNTVQRSES